MRRPLELERLEARDCPALTLASSAGSLTISGTPTGNLTITGTATPSRFTIVDGVKTYGTYAITSNLNLALSSRPGVVRIDLNGNTIIGNLSIDLGNGFTGSAAAARDVDVYDSQALLALGAGTVRGSLSVLNGDGNEFVGVGYFVPTAQERPITVRGNATVSGRASIPIADRLQVGEGTLIAGSAAVTNYDSVNFGSQVNNISTLTNVRGDVTVTTSGPGGGLAANFFGVFGRNVTVNANAPTTSFNSVLFNSPAVNTDTTVGGNVSVTMCSSLVRNSLEVLHDNAGTGTVRIAGTTSFTSKNNSLGAVADLINLEGVFSKAVTINVQNQGSNFSFGPTGQINGDLNFTAGNGTNNFGTNNGNVFSGNLLGNLNVTVGNGDNTLDLQRGISGKFTYMGGNAVSNTVSLSPVSPNTAYVVDLTFGAGTNSLTFNGDATDLVTGFVYGQAAGMNSYNPTAFNTTGLILVAGR